MEKEKIKKLTDSYKVIKSNGALNPYALEKFFKENSTVMDELLGESKEEKIYLLYHNPSKCVVCGNPTSFISFSKGYYKTCSSECKKITSKWGADKVLSDLLPL